VHGLCQALQKVGLPRTLMSDRGAAMLAGELMAGLHHLGILHLPTLPYSPHVNGKQENLWGRVEGRLLDKLRREELIPLGSRIRTRLATGVATRDELLACLEHLLASAGNAGLMTPELRHTLVDHAAGNHRLCIGIAAELLMAAAQRDLTVLDEKLYLQVFATPATQHPRRPAAGGR
jgi:transposase InsO family protein